MRRSRPTVAASGEIHLDSFLPFRLNRLAGEVSRRLSTVYSGRFGLDIPEWRVLATLSSRGSATAHEIVASTRTHKSTISRAVGTLTERGLIERTGSPNDGRELMLQLSDGGLRLMRELVPLVLEAEQEILRALADDERGQLLKAISAVEAALGLSDEESET